MMCKYDTVNDKVTIKDNNRESSDTETKKFLFRLMNILTVLY